MLISEQKACDYPCIPSLNCSVAAFKCHWKRKATLEASVATLDRQPVKASQLPLAASADRRKKFFMIYK